MCRTATLQRWRCTCSLSQRSDKLYLYDTVKNTVVQCCTAEPKHFSHLIKAVPTHLKNSSVNERRRIVKPDANITTGFLDLTGCLHKIL